MRLKEKRIEEIYKTLIDFSRRNNASKTNSFIIDTNRGTTYVECREYEVYICENVCDDNGKENQLEWAGSLLAASQRLEMLAADLKTIEC